MRQAAETGDGPDGPRSLPLYSPACVAYQRSMPSSAFPDLLSVDWSKLPAPVDDGAARHLDGMALPDVVLAATDRNEVSLATLRGRTVVFAYPRTGRPGDPAMV